MDVPQYTAIHGCTSQTHYYTVGFHVVVTTRSMYIHSSSMHRSRHPPATVPTQTHQYVTHNNTMPSSIQSRLLRCTSVPPIRSACRWPLAACPAQRTRAVLRNNALHSSSYEAVLCANPSQKKDDTRVQGFADQGICMDVLTFMTRKTKVFWVWIAG